MTYQMRHPPKLADDRALLLALRNAIEDRIEADIALLDALDGDPDIEPVNEDGGNIEDDCQLDVDIEEGDDEQDGDGEFAGGILLGADETTFCLEGENPADWSIGA